MRIAECESAIGHGGADNPFVVLRDLIKVGRKPRRICSLHPVASLPHAPGLSLSRRFALPCQVAIIFDLALVAVDAAIKNLSSQIADEDSRGSNIS